MADTDYPKKENDWQKIHYSGDDANKKTKLTRIIDEWRIKATSTDGSEIPHTKQIIERLIELDQGALLFYTGRSRRQIKQLFEEKDIPKPLKRYIQHLEEQSKKPHTLDLTIRAILNSSKIDKEMKEYMLAIFQIERARRIRSQSGWNNSNLEIAERIIKSTKNRFRHFFHKDGDYKYEYFDNFDYNKGDKKYFLPIRCLPTFIILQESLCSYRRCHFDATLSFVKEGLEELENTKSKGRFYAYHLIEWWFYYVRSRVYEGTYEIEKYGQTLQKLEQCKMKMRPNVADYLDKVSKINELSAGQEKYLLLKEYHIGLHLFIYNGPSSMEKSEERMKIIGGSSELNGKLPNRPIGFAKSVDEKLIRAINGFREEEKGKLKTLPSNFKFPGLWSRNTSLPVDDYLNKLDKSILCAEVLLNSASERRDHLLPSILKLVLIDTFTKLRFLFNGLAIALKKKPSNTAPDYNKYKEEIRDLVFLSRGIIANKDFYEGAENIPIADWVSQIEEVLSKVKISSIDDLGHLIGSFIGFEYIGAAKQAKNEKNSDKTDRLYRERRNVSKLKKIKEKLQSDIQSSERKLDINQLSKDVELDYNFLLLLISAPANMKFLSKELNEYGEDTPLKTEINAWPSDDKYRRQNLLQLCVPDLDKDLRLVRYSAKPICLFMTENGKHFSTYRGIVGERNIRS